MNLDYFKKQDNFYKGLQTLFNSLNIPVNYIDEKPLKPQDILSKTYKDTNPAYQLMGDVYILGMVDDKAFEGIKSENIPEIKKRGKDYDGILIFGVTLTDRENSLLPTRTQLAEVTRAFNREFHYTPVVVVFRYENHISLASAERLKYKQEWREGEKAGKVSILRDVEIKNPHTGHLKILEELKITRSGKKGINSFEGLYQYWQKVFSVSLLNKKFYTELSNWYFWAIKKVSFPGVLSETDSGGLFKIESKVKEHNAKNIIRLLTRLLFVWFIKEKKLIPEELFDLEALQKNILKKISPFHEKHTLFDKTNKDDSKKSIYYKAILQNLFFATLNCPVKPDSVDSRERGFRGDESYGKHRGVDYLMRYKNSFKDPDAFLEMVNRVVPFLNGGLFECLDDKENKIYIDGFSDNMSKTNGEVNNLIVPDYLFFGREEKTDLSSDLGAKNKGTKESAVKGLINILKSYKFTIAENTPIEEDVALDPELLGKVFENLLASYNPETKTTARKQTGSFYTPREIVNYMVDESLIAHLKNSVFNWNMEEKELDGKLHKLVSFDPVNPFNDNISLSKEIIQSLDNCKILDPACGSGAFPMGILQKMVHILQKVDPENGYWQDLQLEKAKQESDDVFIIKDKEERKNLLDDINDAFDLSINNPDYARKLFLVENCIYGVDIQPIAAQISKLRFFISLVVEQKVNKEKDNFGIRPLPNLETRFVTANTLIGIEKDEELFLTEEVKKKEAELKAIRHKLFGAKTKATKVKYRKKDEELRNEIADILKKRNLPVESAEQLAKWDPYDQNGVSPFFDPEWMFDIKDGFDIVIGNPPYVQIQKFSGQQCQKDWESQKYKTFVKTGDIYSLFYEKGNQVLRDGGILAFITSNKWMRANYGKKTRKYFTESTIPLKLIDFGGYKIFDSATVDTNILIFAKKEKQISQNQRTAIACTIGKDFNSKIDIDHYLKVNGVELINLSEESWIISSKAEYKIQERIEEIGTPLKEWDILIHFGIKTGFNKAFIIDGAKKDEFIAKDPKSAEILKPILRGRDIKRYKAEFADLWLINSHNGYGNVPPINIDDYPAIKNHLDNYWANIEKRYDKGVTPYNLRNCAYIEEFEKEKIVWKRIGSVIRFSYSQQGELCLDSTVIATGKDVKYLTALLNSKLHIKELIDNSPKTGTGDAIISVQALEPLLVHKPSQKKRLPFEILVDCILFAKENNMKTEADTFESVIDGMVYDLYFEEDMKKANCYITDRVNDVLKPFKKDDSDEFKKEYIEKLHTFCRNDKTIFRGLIHRRNVKVVKIINGETK
ncbi:N-6 DNA methylase [Desulfobacula sp.]|uniref:Eco57I restriction-modification methylase domain-containing protein n=1 Tax=Desulfobacula sp. TaxID=2593537 RepID=UPI0025C43EF5|nr:N-6 DNA methylase [Desulfobacula sp.]MBC2703727.1 Eco57I restriction-modification methylase domain-containing protein [Desulfobacula sp.]